MCFICAFLNVATISFIAPLFKSDEIFERRMEKLVHLTISATHHVMERTVMLISPVELAT